jgi:hypothetical protein
VVDKTKALSDADKAALEQMIQGVKKELKQHSKNTLIRMLAATLVDLHIYQKAFSQLSEAQAAAATEEVQGV